jgi:predicted HTH domain antitoxin
MTIFKNHQSLKNESESRSLEFFEAYLQKQISLGKLAELLEISIEEAKAQLQAKNISLDLGVTSESDLLSDIKNA